MKDLIEGIVISELSYGETSKIINILTKDYGIIGCIAKGAKTLKSNLRSSTTKLTYGYFSMNYKKDKLSILNSVDVINPFNNIKKDITKISYATYLVELAEQVVKQNNNPKIYEFLIASLTKINENFNPNIITNILELKYLEYLGVLPRLDCCQICGNKTNIATLSSTRGGFICYNCLTNDKIVSEKTIKLIRMFYYVDISKIEKLDISSNIIKEIDEFLNEYYDKYTGLYLKSKKFLKNLIKVGWFMKEYIYIICPFTALIICQLLKFLIESIKYKKINIERLFNGSGGMPSTHTTFATSLTMIIGYKIGFNTPIFAVCLIFTLITSYDALGVRYESGKQASAINMLVDKVDKEKRIQGFKKLKEQLGHEPLEVFVGMFLGTFIASIFNLM